MSRGRVVALVAAALLAGCPLPQPVPDYPPGAVAPPRIVVDDSVSQISSPETVVRVPANCTTPPGYLLDAQIRDATTTPVGGVEVRWFVNYDPGNSSRYAWLLREVINTTDPDDPTLRHLTPFPFLPYDYDSISGSMGRPDEGALRVVELVASNGFYSSSPFVPGNDEPLANRSPAKGFEIQVYRWIFLNVQAPAGCTLGEPGCCPP